jgi:hypothetical protein
MGMLVFEPRQVRQQLLHMLQGKFEVTVLSGLSVTLNFQNHRGLIQGIILNSKLLQQFHNACLRRRRRRFELGYPPTPVKESFEEETDVLILVFSGRPPIFFFRDGLFYVRKTSFVLTWSGKPEILDKILQYFLSSIIK